MNAPASAQSAPAFLVAIGASAGGLASFKALLPGLPRGLGAAYVLLQHLDPDHPSLLAELLAEVSPFPIHPIEDGMAPLADTLYLCPAGRQCELNDGVFRLQTLRGHGPRRSIDRLLTSVARHYPDRCTGIILSGAGNDGLQGIREIKNNGGWALAEDPGDAEYGSMPRSLVDHHLADIVGPAAGLGGQLAEILRLASEQAPDHVLNNALSGMVVLDRNLQVIRHSANCRELFGLASDGADCKSQLTARLQALPGLAAWLQEAIAEGRGRQREQDLNERHFQLRLIPVPEPDSDAVHSLILTFYDETLRRQQEQESRLLAAIVRSSADAIIVHDEAGNILSWNTGAANMYGYSESEAQARTIEDIIDKGSRRAYRTFLDGLLRGETPGALELQGLDRDGRPLDISLNASVLQGPPGESRRVALIQRDITEKNATEQKLNALVESTPDPIIIVEADGTIQRVNRQAETLFGYSRKQLLGSSYKMLIPERYRAHHDLYHKQFQSKPVMRDMGSGLELSCLNAEGEEIPVEIGLSPVVVQDEASTLVRFRDVRKARQEQRILREAKQAADEANRTKSRFLAAASHDLRQPLQSISMYLGVLAGELAAPDKAKVVDQARMALDTTNKLLNSLLNITKLESGKVQPEITAFPVRDMLARVYNTESPHAREKHHHFALVQSSAVVSSDPALLEQLVTNLVANAIKYTPEHGHIVLGCRRQGRFIKVQVSDNGPGIASEELDVIFDEYRQLEYNGHYLGKGLGLGLSIVKLIAELLHLQMEVKSTPGKGSSFSVLVPAGAPSAPRVPAPETEAAPASAASGTLLLVEDDLAVLESTSLFLELAGYQIVTARSSAHAMEAVETVRPDLIISDFGLGEDMNGIQVVEALRQRLGQQVPGIIVTGDTSDQRAQEALDAGCRIVRKPIEAHLLQRAVQALL